MKTVATEEPAGAALRRVLAGRHHDPFDVLGCHRQGGHWYIRALLPGAAEAGVVVGGRSEPMQRLPDTDLFIAKLVTIMPMPYLCYQMLGDDSLTLQCP